MSINHHKLYLNNVFALAATLVIKSKYSADCINNRLIALYGASAVDLSQPATWKYYLNICGEYHPRDTMITVRSLDTLQTINFTKTNLLTHTATARAYQYGSRYYRELVAQYPDYEELILGILYPASLSQALAAPDFSVLSYPSHLVEENEESLINNINDWLDKFQHRWKIDAFHLTDELYGASLLGVMYGQMISLILSLRMRACRTPEVHSYHVRQYLASHGMLDTYLTHMTRKQALFFYRNASYIEHHSGKASTFAWLTEKVLTDRGLPLVEYQMRHDTSQMPGELTPEVRFTTNPLNRIASKSPNGITTAALMAKEVAIATGNLERISRTVGSTEQKLMYSLQATAKTKVLESSLVQNADNSTQSIQETALSLWGYAAATGKYSVYTRVKNPITGEELTLSMLQAYHYFFYAYCMVHSKQLQTVPLIYAQFIPRVPAPTLTEVMNHIDRAYVSEAKVIELMTLNPSLTAFVNADMFRDGCTEIFNAVNRQATLVAQEEHFYSRGLLHGAFAKQYSDYLLTTAETGQNIKTYFSTLDIPTEGFNELQWQQIYLDLFQACTGFDMQATIQTSDLQRAMVRLMAQLSSYSVQFVSELSGSSVRSLNWSAVRLGDNSGASRSYFEIIIHMLEVFRLKSDVKMYLPVPVLPISSRFSIKTPNYHLGMHEIPVDVKPDNTVTASRHEVIIHAAGVDFDDRFDPNASTAIESWEVFETMTDEELGQVEDVYSTQCRKPAPIPTKIDINDVIHNTTLSSFAPLDKPTVILPAWRAYWGPKNMRYFTDENSVIVLDGIWYFGGENQIDSFIPTIGNALVNSFKYAGGSNVDIDITYYDYGGGPLTTITFAPGSTNNDIDVGIMNQLPDAIDLPLVSDVRVLDAVTFSNNVMIYDDMVMSSFHDSYQFRFIYASADYDIGSLMNNTVIPVLAFNQMAPRLVMTPFATESRSITLPTFTADVNAYHLLPLYHLFEAFGPSFKGWGNIEVQDMDPVVPSQEQMDDTPSIQLASVVKQESVTLVNVGSQVLNLPMSSISNVQELAFTSVVTEVNAPSVPSPMVIDILDFEAVMATLPPP